MGLCNGAVEDQRRRSKGADEPPMFIAGHSLGGLIAPLACLQTQRMWRGMLLGSPGLGFLKSNSLSDTVAFKCEGTSATKHQDTCTCTCAAARYAVLAGFDSTPHAVHAGHSVRWHMRAHPWCRACE